MESISSWLKQHAITEVECLVPDMTGNARGKFIPATKFIHNEGLRLPESVLVQTVTGEYPKNFYELLDPRDRDMQLKPDPNSIRKVPWANEPTAQIIHDCYTMEDIPHPLSTRNVLKRVLKAYEELGLKPIVAPEVEFYLVKKNVDPDYELEPPLGRSGRPESARQSYSIDAVNEFEPIIEQMYSHCEAQSLDVDTLIHESGAAQMEVNFLHGDALSLADQVFTFKRTMREIAVKHNIYATFMARPMANEPGSSMHVHQSLIHVKDGKNAFIDDKGKHSELFHHYIGGLQHYSPYIIALMAPNVNSYRRFLPDIAAPISLHWGIDNRTVGFRVPHSTPQATRVENRFAGADANPYLAIASTLACGLLGIKEQQIPEPAFNGNAYAEKGIKTPTFASALEAIHSCEPIAKLIGTPFIKAFQSVKHTELEQFNQVISSWEREHLLLNV